jgi:hypothetical protein
MASGMHCPVAWGRRRDSLIQGRTRAKREMEVLTVATEAYCVKCREKREMKDPKEVTMKNGRDAVEGVCPVCGTKLFRMVGKKK